VNKDGLGALHLQQTVGHNCSCLFYRCLCVRTGCQVFAAFVIEVVAFFPFKLNGAFRACGFVHVRFDQTYLWFPFANEVYCL